MRGCQRGRGYGELQPALKGRLGALEPVDRIPFASEPDASLLRLPLEVKAGSGDTVAIMVGVVVVKRVARAKPVLIAYVPVIPNFDVLGGDGDIERLATRVAARVAKRLRSWSAATVLNADEPEDSRLEVVDIEVESGTGGDLFPLESPLADGAGGGDREGILQELGVELTRREGGRIDGRDELVQRALEMLAAPDRSSILLVGPPDVGKTALVYEIARRIGAGETPQALHGRSVWRVSANELIAGAMYTGQWQERVRRLIEQARRTRAVVVMGDPVGIVDAGRWSRSDNNVSRYLRPYVESGEITIVWRRRRRSSRRR